VVSVDVHLKFGETINVWRDEENMSDLITRISVTKRGVVKFVDKRYG
jgi:hypothetical protein